MNKYCIAGAVGLAATLAIAVLSEGQSVQQTIPSAGLAASAAAPAPQMRAVKGKIKLFRVQEPGSTWGAGANQIWAEVVVVLHDQPHAFGFQLRQGKSLFAHQGMLDLLRDAYRNKWLVTCWYLLEPGKTNGMLVRVQVETP